MPLVGETAMKCAWMAWMAVGLMAAAVMMGGCGNGTGTSGAPDNAVQTPAGGKVEGTGQAPKAQGALAWVDRLRVGEPAGFGNLLVYPVFVETPAIGAEYLTLEEAVKGKLARVTEVGHRETPEQTRMTVAEVEAQIAKDSSSQGNTEGTVSSLLIHNHSDKPIFILAGQTVCGGKQDRICPDDYVIPPHESNHEVKVFCVEAGRWQGGISFSTASLATEDVRSTARVLKDQGLVWEKVAAVRDQAANASGYSPAAGAGTGAYREAANDPKLKEKAAPYLAALSTKWKDEKKLAGFVAVVDGWIQSADVFNDAAVFAKLRGDLMTSYVTRAAILKGAAEKTGKARKAPAQPVTKADVEAFIKSAYENRQVLNENNEAGWDYGEASIYGSSGGDKKLGHLYMSVIKDKDDKDKDNATEPPKVEEQPKK